MSQKMPPFIFQITPSKNNLFKREAKDVLPNINRTQTTERAKKCHFLSLVTLTFDLDLQTRPSEGPNMSSA